MLKYEDALRKWGAMKLMTKYSGVKLEDIDLSAVNVSIEVDPGFPEAEDSFYRPANAYVAVSARLNKNVEATYRVPQGMWGGTKMVTETLTPKTQLSINIDYPDMFEIVREMSELS